MSKELKTLIRLGKWTVDEKRRVLATLYDTEAKTEKHIRDLDARLVAEQKIMASDPLAAVTYHAFYDHHKKRRHTAQKVLDGIREQIETARDDLSEAYRELKTYETALATRERLEAEERDRTEQKVLDEIGANLHRRKEAP